jgi:hypothetical protein
MRTDLCDRRCGEAKRTGFFVWGPGCTYNWPPIRLRRGHDEHHRQTIGIESVIGAVFFAWKCRVVECPCREPEAHYREGGDRG